MVGVKDAKFTTLGASRLASALSRLSVVYSFVPLLRAYALCFFLVLLTPCFFVAVTHPAPLRGGWGSPVGIVPARSASDLPRNVFNIS